MSFTPTTPPGTIPWQFTTGNTGWNNTSVIQLSASNTVFTNYLSAIEVVNLSTVNATLFYILDGSNTIFVGYLPEANTLVAGSPPAPQNIQFNAPLRGTVNNALSVVFGTTGANVFFNAQGFLGGRTSS